MITLSIPDFWGGALAGCAVSILCLLALALVLGWVQRQQGRHPPPPGDKTPRAGGDNSTRDPQPGGPPRIDPNDGPRNPWQVG